MAFLNATDPATIKALRAGMIGLGYKAQRSAHGLAKRLGLLEGGRRSARRPRSAGRRSRRR
jgi:hypothetical protein